MYNSDNPFLNGNYAPWREEGDAYDLEIEGELPRELNGALYRVGPNPHFKPAGRYHWFDGDGMVHAFILRDGRAAYRNRYVRTDGLKAEMKQGRALYGGLLEMAKELPPDQPPFKNAANTNIIGYANRLLALWEAGLPHELKPETLETVGLFDFGGKMTGPVTAHPKFDPVTGDLLFFGYQPFPPYVTWYRADKSGKLIESRAVDSGLPVMMHDFIATDNYAIFFVCPSVFHMENAAAGKPMLAWEPQHGTKIGAMNRQTGEVKWFHDDAFFVFHFLNAYEENGTLVVDGCRMAALDMTGNSFGGNPPLPWRWNLKLGDGSMTQEQIDDVEGEFPRLNERRAGLKHRYGYFAGGNPGSPGSEQGFKALLKRDYQTGKLEAQSLGANFAPGEPVFVPRGRNSAEDDGWVLAVWYDEALNRSEMVVLDAQNFSGAPVARVKLQHRVPWGFHGNWVPAQ
ncbi:MAG TPA: carotenoid oxygenase family protein [Candidatus Acidoferrales bacterium]|nr:carotenoid oxygenase family protein [Candidatus Acidoferrales bacterium]